jgi:hypothetical protein
VEALRIRNLDAFLPRNLELVPEVRKPTTHQIDCSNKLLAARDRHANYQEARRAPSV